MEVTISYAITVCNEHEELKRLLQTLLTYLNPEDEIVIQADSQTVTQEVKSLMFDYIKPDLNKFNNIKIVFNELNKDFAAFKNKLKTHCTKSHIFFIDADEYPDNYLLEVLRPLLTQNSEVDLFLIPRINTVEGITKEHIRKWRWMVDEKSRINHPDYQTRLIRNKPEIMWSGRVHEKIVGFKTITQLPSDIDQLSLYHPKTIERQEKQNNFYNTL